MINFWEKFAAVLRQLVTICVLFTVEVSRVYLLTSRHARGSDFVPTRDLLVRLFTNKAIDLTDALGHDDGTDSDWSKDENNKKWA